MSCLLHLPNKVRSSTTGVPSAKNTLFGFNIADKISIFFEEIEKNCTQHDIYKEDFLDEITEDAPSINKERWDNVLAKKLLFLSTIAYGSQNRTHLFDGFKKRISKPIQNKIKKKYIENLLSVIEGELEHFSGTKSHDLRKKTKGIFALEDVILKNLN